MKTMKECESMTNPQLLVEIRNRNTLLKSFNPPGNGDTLKEEIAKLWKLMERNGYKK